MANFQLEDEIYTTRLWISPGNTSKGSGLGVGVRNKCVNNRYECIEGLRGTNIVFKLFFSPNLPRGGIDYSYDGKTGILQLNYENELLLHYEIPSGSASVGERFKIR